jgi:hypothetical protein
MAEEFSLGDSNEYFRYKKHDKDAFGILLPAKSYKDWRVKILLREVIQVVPELDKTQLNAVIHHLEQSSKLREKLSSRFRYAPLQQQNGHSGWEQVIQHVINLANSEAAKEQVEELQATTILATEAAEDQIREIQATTISVTEATFLCFLEDIESCINHAEALWQRVAARKVPLSTASTRL